MGLIIQSEMINNNSVLCYCASVNKQLRAETLAQALKHLILYNEMLQVGFENRRYVPEPETREQPQNDILSIYDCAGKSPVDVEAFIRQIIKKLASEMRCERNASVRATLLNIGNDHSKLLLLSCRVIADQRGLVLMFEDLYRIYEQLSNEKKVALRPVRKTYTEFIDEVVTKKGAGEGDLSIDSKFRRDLSEFVISDPGPREEAGMQKTSMLSIVLDQNLKRRLFSWRLAEFKLLPVEALAGALLRSLARASRGGSVNLCVKSDYRFADERLKFTTAALTETYKLPTDFAEKCGLLSDIKKLRGILRDIPLHNVPEGLPQSSPQCPESSNTSRQVRLNFEYLTDDPWLGGDEWRPEGFIVPEQGRLTSDYSLEITPVFSSDGISIVVAYKEMPALKALVDRFVADLVLELEVILRYCEGYIDAKEFWVREFAKAIPQMRIEVESDGHKVADEGHVLQACKVEKPVINRALLDFVADESQLLLSAFAILLSRLSGSEDLVILCALNKEDVSAAFPLRLDIQWSSTFKLFINQVKGKVRQAAVLGEYAFDILSEEQTKHGRQFPIPDVGFIFERTVVKNGSEQSTNGLQSRYPPFNQAPDLILEITESDSNLDLRFAYKEARFGGEIIERFGVYLNSILEDVTRDANIKLEDIEFEKVLETPDVTSILTGEAFSF